MIKVKMHYANAGFTLVELIIVIAIAAVLMAVAVPLGRGWVDSSQVNNAVANLKHGTLLAKSAALRNANNRAMGVVATSLCFDKSNQTLQVVLDSCATGQLVQHYSMAKGVNVQENGIEFKCLAYDSAGVLVPAAGCTTNTANFSVKKNSDEVIIDVI